MSFTHRLSFFYLFGSLLLASCATPQESNGDNWENDQDGKKKSNQTVTKHDGPSHLNVAFYNVENLFDTQDDRKKKDDDFTPNGRNKWTKDRYRTKLDHLTEVLVAMKEKGELPAMIGVAEIENEAVLEDLADRLAGQGASYGIAHKDSKDMRGIDTGLLYRKDFFENTSEDAIRIDFTQRGFTSRDILHFSGRLFNGEQVHAFVNHWPSRREGWQKTEQRRVDAASTLKREVDDILRDDQSANIIILGDFNDYPDNKSIEQTLGAKKRADKKNRLSNLAYPFEKRGLGTYNYKGDWGMLDQAIVSGALLDGKGLDVADEGLEIFERDFMMYYDRKHKEHKPNKTYGGPKYYGGYSDHLPILLHLELID